MLAVPERVPGASTAPTLQPATAASQRAGQLAVRLRDSLEGARRLAQRAGGPRTQADALCRRDFAGHRLEVPADPGPKEWISSGTSSCNNPLRPPSLLTAPAAVTLRCLLGLSSSRPFLASFAPASFVSSHWGVGQLALPLGPRRAARRIVGERPPTLLSFFALKVGRPPSLALSPRPARVFLALLALQPRSLSDCRLMSPECVGANRCLTVAISS
jgi:hypothetical protein